MTRAVQPKDDRPARLTPPQRKVLTLLRDGWTLSTCGRDAGPFHKLLFYGFHRGDEIQYASGTTLGSLVRRDLVMWEATTLTLAYDGSQVPGCTLRLTPIGTALVTD